MRRRWLWVVPCVGLLASCVESSGAQSPPTTAAQPTTSVAPTTTAEPTTTTAEPTTTTTTTAPTTTAAPTTTTMPPVPISGTLGQGAMGPEVALVQQRLLELHFDPGEPDGKFDTAMTQAVWAYQKLAGGAVDGQVTPELWLRMQQPFVPKPLVDGGEPDRVEIDLPRQVLITYKGGSVVLITHISTGRSAVVAHAGGQVRVHLAMERLAHLEAGPPLQPGVLQPGHRRARREGGAHQAGVTRLRAHPDAHRRVLPRSRRARRAGLRAGRVPAVQRRRCRCPGR